ncbi:unnamed protein product, partial [Allacma fusca]
ERLRQEISGEKLINTDLQEALTPPGDSLTQQKSLLFLKVQHMVELRPVVTYHEVMIRRFFRVASAP